VCPDDRWNDSMLGYFCFPPMISAIQTTWKLGGMAAPMPGRDR
jgi:hypothetical protein